MQNGQREVCFEQWLPLPPDQIFPYFSAEKNLEELTPSFLKFRVLGKNTPSIERGTLIDYRLSIHGVPARWQTEITDWQPNRVFVDEQRSGPYRRWVHTHEFNALGGGTLMRDRVQYKLPLGLVGDVVGHWQVARDVQQIFDYRRRIIFDRFGTRQS